MVYLYSEISTNPASEIMLQMATRRAERMETYALPADKDKAYLAGMFSMLDIILEANIKDLMGHINMDKDINSLVIDRKGKFAESFLKVEKSEREYLKKLVDTNFEKININNIIYTLDLNGIAIDRNKL
jgi:EAL and modified HD-GYP domain-containing signal transduction protein